MVIGSLDVEPLVESGSHGVLVWLGHLELGSSPRLFPVLLVQPMSLRANNRLVSPGCCLPHVNVTTVKPDAKETTRVAHPHLFTSIPVAA